jgi:UDP-glucose 4-epimerase
MAFARIASALESGARFDLYGDGGQSRGWTYVSDVVDATMLAMEHGSGTYNVGGAIEASMNDAIAILEEISGRTLDVHRTEPVPGDQRRTNADTARIRSELGWEPRVSLEHGLRNQWRWASSRVAAS